MRRKNCLLYPGACSLEYQSLMQIVLECLFNWDSKNQKGRDGIVGIVEAFCRADEEQGRGSLHSHWLIWIARINRLRKMMLSADKAERQAAIDSFVKYVNKAMSAKYRSTNHLSAKRL